MKTFRMNFKQDQILAALEIPTEIFDFVGPNIILNKINFFMRDYGFESFQTLSSVRNYWGESSVNERNLYFEVEKNLDFLIIKIYEIANCWIEESK